MNPVLVKPEGDERSQVVVLCRADLELSRQPWRARRTALWPVIESALAALLEEHQLVLLEGAGSPAEMNLRETDLANMRRAKAAGAPVVRVADMHAGGRWCSGAGDLVGPALVVLPASKHGAADLAWLRRSGLAYAVAAHRGRVLGICGGLQILGRRIDDDAGVDGSGEGLGRLPVA